MSLKQCWLLQAKNTRYLTDLHVLNGRISKRYQVCLASGTQPEAVEHLKPETEILVLDLKLRGRSNRSTEVQEVLVVNTALLFWVAHLPLGFLEDQVGQFWACLGHFLEEMNSKGSD